MSLSIALDACRYPYLQALHITDNASMEIDEDKIIIRTPQRVRGVVTGAFKKMGTKIVHGDDPRGDDHADAGCLYDNR